MKPGCMDAGDNIIKYIKRRGEKLLKDPFFGTILLSSDISRGADVCQ